MYILLNVICFNEDMLPIHIIFVRLETKYMRLLSCM